MTNQKKAIEQAIDLAVGRAANDTVEKPATEKEHSYWVTQWLTDRAMVSNAALEEQGLVPGISKGQAWRSFYHWVHLPESDDDFGGENTSGPFSGYMAREMFHTEMFRRFPIVKLYGKRYYAGVCVSIV